MNIDANFLNITVTHGQNIGKVTGHRRDKQKQYMYLLIDNVPGPASYITHAKNTNFNKEILEVLRTSNSVFEIGPFV